MSVVSQQRYTLVKSLGQRHHWTSILRYNMTTKLYMTPGRYIYWYRSCCVLNMQENHRSHFDQRSSVHLDGRIPVFSDVVCLERGNIEVQITPLLDSSVLWPNSFLGS